jgi:hypothetical protein
MVDKLLPRDIRRMASLKTATFTRAIASSMSQTTGRGFDRAGGHRVQEAAREAIGMPDRIGFALRHGDFLS